MCTTRTVLDGARPQWAELGTRHPPVPEQRAAGRVPSAHAHLMYSGLSATKAPMNMTTENAAWSRVWGVEQLCV